MYRNPAARAAAMMALALAAQPLAAQEVATVDRLVGHRSTVPAIEGQFASLFVREKGPASIVNASDGQAEEGKVVLFVHGGFTPPTVAFDLPFADYSWMGYLAENGYDVFTMEMTGYGMSSRPMMEDPCNTSRSQQEAVLVPLEFAEPCEPSYPFELVSSDSETADIHAVVEFIKALRGVDKVTLIGWSGGGIRTGTYTYRHPENVDKLIIWASSNYSRDNPDSAPETLPAPGVPVTIQPRETGELDRWLGTQTCEDQIEPGVPELVWLLSIERDSLGASWGPGVLRAPVRTYWGWNATNAGTINVPVLIIVGENDRLIESNRLLFDDLGSDRKAFLAVECGTHYMAWERTSGIMREASLEWLESTTLNGAESGRFRADVGGSVSAVD
jgi:pimeloyl-ACP methyl ester carboxylesterase